MELRDSKNCLVIYVPRSAQDNFTFSLEHGIWGFPREWAGLETLKAGDYILFGGGFTGGSPRVSAEDWSGHTITGLTIGTVTRELYVGEEPFWPNEKPGETEYPYRFGFRVLLQIQEPTKLNSQGPLGDASDALRMGAINNQGYLIPVSSIPILTELEAEHIGGKPTPVDPHLSAEQGDAADDPSSTRSILAPDLPRDWDWDEQMDALIQNIKATGFVFEPWQIAAYVTALRTKPFVILAGISGTGKSQLPQLVAKACGFDAEVIPVRPDWTDSSDLLGYTDLSGVFRSGRFLELAEQSELAPEKSLTVVLDEMNLARVEHYFAEVLSRIEDRSLVDGVWYSKPLLSMDGHSEKAHAHWSKVTLPPNLAIVGTVNMDETTHSFSRKVLDRAFTLEMSDVDLQEWGARQERDSTRALMWPAGAIVPPVASLASPNENLTARSSRIETIIGELERLNEELKAAQLQIGYRTRDEIVLFDLNAQEVRGSFVDGKGITIEPLDLAISMKVLPRITGGSGATRRVLLGILAWATGYASIEEADADRLVEEWRSAGRPSSMEDHAFPRCAARLCLMWERLRDQGFTSYWL